MPFLGKKVPFSPLPNKPFFTRNCPFVLKTGEQCLFSTSKCLFRRLQMPFFKMKMPFFEDKVPFCFLLFSSFFPSFVLAPAKMPFLDVKELFHLWNWRKMPFSDKKAPLLPLPKMPFLVKNAFFWTKKWPFGSKTGEQCLFLTRKCPFRRL